MPNKKETPVEDLSKSPKRSRSWDAKPSHKVIHTVATIIVTLAIVCGGAYAYYFFSADTQTVLDNSKSQATIRTVASATSENIRFDETSFSFMLPPDWKKTGELTTGPHHKFSYKSMMKDADNRYLDVYMDSLPLDMAVNKVVAVRGEGDKLTHGVVSDNCTTFTNKTGSLKVPAKWDGVDFLCDMDATTRNVVGTSAPGSINKVELTSVGFTKRSFFFVYTDHNYTPEYSIFYKMLESFTVK